MRWEDTGHSIREKEATKIGIPEADDALLRLRLLVHAGVQIQVSTWILILSTLRNVNKDWRDWINGPKTSK